MWRISFVTVICFLCAACDSGISSYEDAMDAQTEIMSEMVVVLEGVDDEASAERAAGQIEALGKRLGEVATQIQKLPPPTNEEIQELTQRQGADAQEFQARAAPQMMKLAEYESLMNAWTRALSSLQ